MNKDELLNLVPLAVTVLAPIGAKYGFSAGDLTAFLTGLAGVAAGIWLHWNQRKVPETAVAVIPAGLPGANPPAGVTVTGKVVASIAIAIGAAALLGLLLPGTAHAGICDNVPPLACENYVRTWLEIAVLGAVAIVGLGVLIAAVLALVHGSRFLFGIVALAAALSVLAWAPQASAQALTQPAAAPARPAVHHKAPVPLPHARPSAAALEAFAAATPQKTATTAPGAMTTTAVQQNPLKLLQQFSVDDLNAALLDAQAQTPPDTTAINCYTALIPIVQSNVANPLPAGPGAFQLAQKVRDFKALTANLQSPNGPLASLNQACAAWVLDGVNTFLGLGAQLGLVVGTGGLGGVLPAVPGLGLLPFKLP